MVLKPRARTRVGGRYAPVSMEGMEKALGVRSADPEYVDIWAINKMGFENLTSVGTFVCSNLSCNFQIGGSVGGHSIDLGRAIE